MSAAMRCTRREVCDLFESESRSGSGGNSDMGGQPRASEHSEGAPAKVTEEEAQTLFARVGGVH